MGGRSLVVWRLKDGKPGHENQTLGLANALGRLHAVKVHDITVPPRWRSWLALLTGRCPDSADLPAPDLLLGAGHRTHAALLACRRACGGRAVVLMRPSLPLKWFDLCLVPAHDDVAPSNRVVTTQGVLNAVTAAAADPARPGLILVGGPSAHHGWDQKGLVSRLRAIIDRDARSWLLVTSRRTPDNTERALAGLTNPSVTLVAWRDAEPGWLTSQLPGTPVAWVTADSVSMLYEALTAGAACGVLPVPETRSSRVSEGLRGLLSGGIVTGFEDWQHGRLLQLPPQPFDEATRCARLILDTWFAS